MQWIKTTYVGDQIYKFSYKCKWMVYVNGLFKYRLDYNCNMKIILTISIKSCYNVN